MPQAFRSQAAIAAKAPVPAPSETVSTGLFGPPPNPAAKAVLYGFFIGVAFATLCFAIAGWYLVSYLSYATGAVDAVTARPNVDTGVLVLQIAMAQVLLQSCGLAVGMAFGFLGFSLFLLGIGGNMDASAAAQGGVGIQVARISPGAFVMLCSAILVGLCATQHLTTRFGDTSQAIPDAPILSDPLPANTSEATDNLTATERR